MLSSDFTRILLEHKAKELKLLEYSNKVLIEDTDCLITKFFMNFLKDENIEKNTLLADAIASLNQYDLILYMEPDVKWVQDGDRSEIIAANRYKYGNMIKKLYADSGFRFVCISGTYVERYEQAIKLIEQIL